MPHVRIIGDILTAFSADVELPDGYDTENDETIRERIAAAAGIRKYGAECDFNICDEVLLDENGNEIGHVAADAAPATIFTEPEQVVPPTAQTVYVTICTADGDLVTLKTDAFATRTECVDALLSIIATDCADYDNPAAIKLILAEARTTLATENVFTHETLEFAIVEVSEAAKRLDRSLNAESGDWNALR